MGVWGTVGLCTGVPDVGWGEWGGQSGLHGDQKDEVGVPHFHVRDSSPGESESTWTLRNGEKLRPVKEEVGEKQGEGPGPRCGREGPDFASLLCSPPRPACSKSSSGLRSG